MFLRAWKSIDKWVVWIEDKSVQARNECSSLDLRKDSGIFLNLRFSNYLTLKHASRNSLYAENFPWI